MYVCMYASCQQSNGTPDDDERDKRFFQLMAQNKFKWDYIILDVRH